MTILFQSHSGREKAKCPSPLTTLAVPPAGTDIAVDEQADFGYFVPPLNTAGNYLPESSTTVDELDTLGNLMIDAAADPEDPAPDSTMPPVLTYWGQFLDHELTARTDRESNITSVKEPHPPKPSALVESKLRNARSPRFDLDSVYGGSPIGPGITADVVTVISGLRHPTLVNKMRVGTALEPGPLPDGLDEHRDLPRYVPVQAAVRDAALNVARASLPADEFAKFADTLPQRALIGDTRNDENLVIAQFHLSFLRFHNKAVDFLASHNTGWLPDFASAQTLTRLHYQWLVVEGYLKGVCDPAVVSRVVQDRASHFFKFRAEFDLRRQDTRLGNALPLSSRSPGTASDIRWSARSRLQQEFWPAGGSATRRRWTAVRLHRRRRQHRWQQETSEELGHRLEPVCRRFPHDLRGRAAGTCGAQDRHRARAAVGHHGQGRQ